MNNTYKNAKNTLGLSPSNWEAIKNLQFHLSELERGLELSKRNRESAQDFLGKPLFQMKIDLSEKQKKEAIETHMYILSLFSRFPAELVFEEKELFSVCCGASPKNLGDYDSTEIGVCPKCNEPTNFE